MLKILGLLLLTWVGATILSACSGLLDSEAPAAPPVIVNNTGGDGGAMVLITVLVVFLVLAAVGLAVAWIRAVNEKQRRTAAESALVELTGMPLDRLALMSVRQMRMDPPYGPGKSRLKVCDSMGSQEFHPAITEGQR